MPRSLIEALVRCRPGTRSAERLRRELSRRLLVALKARGLRGVTAAVKRLAPGGTRLRAERRAPSQLAWTAQLGAGRSLRLSAHSFGGMLSTYVEYRVERPAKLTAAQRRRAAVQEAFYERYTRLGRLVYSGKRPRLSAGDRVVLLVGELEADVNNGGFSQYLSNKGGRRARLALAALRRIGARKTAALLQAALSASGGEEFSGLDARFELQAEDLPSLAGRLK